MRQHCRFATPALCMYPYTCICMKGFSGLNPPPKTYMYVIHDGLNGDWDPRSLYSIWHIACVVCGNHKAGRWERGQSQVTHIRASALLLARPPSPKALQICGSAADSRIRELQRRESSPRLLYGKCVFVLLALRRQQDRVSGRVPKPRTRCHPQERSAEDAGKRLRGYGANLTYDWEALGAAFGIEVRM
jgi:hypothetical protein